MEMEEDKKLGDKELPTKQELEQCLAILKAVNTNSHVLLQLSNEQRIELLKTAGILSRPDRVELKKRRKDLNKQLKSSLRKQDKKARETTGIRSARTAEVFTAPDQLLLTEAKKREEVQELSTPRNCYVCKAEFTKLHFFYDTMCQSCGDLNYRKRFQSANLEGQVALITGSRLKIGYHVTLMLLRAGATVIATTRFPADSAIRFAKEKDFMNWCDRLHIHGLDLRHTPSVELFCSYIEQEYTRLDILINNAAQTVRRPPGFYEHLMGNELLDYSEYSNEVQELLPSSSSIITSTEPSTM